MKKLKIILTVVVIVILTIIIYKHSNNSEYQFKKDIPIQYDRIEDLVNSIKIVNSNIKTISNEISSIENCYDGITSDDWSKRDKIKYDRLTKEYKILKDSLKSATLKYDKILKSVKWSFFESDDTINFNLKIKIRK